ncbi:ATP-dependent DNA ligase [Candidatus Woesearchaeota archaeon]|nr:MAG: ATP-dependent DNA ligase [Candidatus Woesearchaeota archaeon]
MKFSQVAKTYNEIEKTSSLIQMRERLALLLKKSTPEEVKALCYLTLGRIAPSYSTILLGMGESMVAKSIAKASGESIEEVKRHIKKTGDAGLAAENLIKSKGKLEIKDVMGTLEKIAKKKGAGSVQEKIEILADLLKKSSGIEARYVVRIVLGQLRLGAGDKTILDALAIAYTGTQKARQKLERAYHIRPDLGEIGKTLASKGLRAVEKIGIKLFVPIQAMLCQRIRELSDVEEKMGFPVAVEHKYDGERVQAHKRGDQVRLFSRRLDDVTSQFPEIVKAVKKLKAKKCIIDGEAIAIDKEGNALPFQTMMQRRRKYEIEEYAKKIPISLRVFDLLYLEGKSLIDESYPKRHEKLEKTVKKSKQLELAERIVCESLQCIDEFFEKMCERGAEGIVIKSMDPSSTYEAGTRGWKWIKWKPEYMRGMRDTFDLVIIGAYWGRGKRSGTYGALLCAIYDDKNDKFLTFCKLGSGFTDAQLKELPKKLTVHKGKPARASVKKNMIPDVWISPETVIEVTGANITKSPSHTSGYALRFPRFVRYRKKKPSQATTLEEIKTLTQERTS